MEKRDFHICIVDDDHTVCRAIGRLVRSYGIQETTFFSGEDFLEFIEKSAPRLPGCLILDIQMPGLSGFDVQARLAADGRRLAIVFITGHDSGKTRERVRMSGATAFLCKPFQAEELLEVLDRIRDGETREGRALDEGAMHRQGDHE